MTAIHASAATSSPIAPPTSVPDESSVPRRSDRSARSVSTTSVTMPSTNVAMIAAPVRKRRRARCPAPGTTVDSSVVNRAGPSVEKRRAWVRPAASSRSSSVGWARGSGRAGAGRGVPRRRPARARPRRRASCAAFPAAGRDARGGGPSGERVRSAGRRRRGGRAVAPGGDAVFRSRVAVRRVRLARVAPPGLRAARRWRGWPAGHRDSWERSPSRPIRRAWPPWPPLPIPCPAEPEAVHRLSGFPPGGVSRRGGCGGSGARGGWVAGFGGPCSSTLVTPWSSSRRYLRSDDAARRETAAPQRLPGRAAAALHDEAGSSLLRVIVGADGYPYGRVRPGVGAVSTCTDGAGHRACCPCTRGEPPARRPAIVISRKRARGRSPPHNAGCARTSCDDRREPVWPHFSSRRCAGSRCPS